jgi:hypothetical protein
MCENPIPTRFPAPIDCSKIPAQEKRKRGIRKGRKRKEVKDKKRKKRSSSADEI